MFATPACCSSETLREHLRGAPAAPETEALEEHLLECPDCLERLKTLMNQDPLLRQMNRRSVRLSLLAAEPAGPEDLPAEVAELIEHLKDKGIPTENVASAARRPVVLPEQLGRYRILEVLGRGGMGTVYRAHDTKLHRTVAIKLPHLHGSEQQQHLAAQRFLREARLAAAVHHRHICAIHDTGEHEGLPYVVLAHIKGETLASRLSGGQRFEDVPAAVELTRQLAEALTQLHAHGIVHRDLKPANILLDHDGKAVLTDFGLAQVLDDAEHLTEFGVLVGTPAFMAPEQTSLTQTAVGPWTDIYCLGVVLYRMLTGRTPFEGPALAVVNRLANMTPPPPAQFRPDLDPALQAILAKAMARNPNDRYTSAHALAVALTAWSNPQSPPAIANARWTSRLVGIAPALLGLLVTIALGQTVIRIYNKDGTLVQTAPVPPGGTFKVATVEPEPPRQMATLSPLDKLAAATHIPPSERLGWLPPEVVAVFGTHAWTHGATFRSTKDPYGVEVPRLAFAPTGQVIASAGNNGVNCAAMPVWIWDAASGESWRRFLHFEQARESFADPQGTWRALVIGTDDAWHVAIVDIVTGQPIGGKFWGLGAQPGHLVLSADRKILATGDGTGRITLWKVAHAPEEMSHFALAGSGVVQSLALSHDGKALAAFVLTEQADRKYSFTVELRSLQRQDDPIRLPGVPYDPAQRLAGFSGHPIVTFSRDGKWLATLHYPTKDMRTNVRLWDLGQNKERLLTFPNKEAFFSTLTFSQDGKQLALATQGGDIVLFDLLTDSCKTLQGHQGQAATLAFSADGKAMASAGVDQTIRLWNLTTGKQKNPERRSEGTLRRIALGADRWLGTIDGNGDLTLRDLAGEVALRTLERHPKLAYHDLAFTPDGKALLTAYNNGVLFDTATGKPTELRLGPARAVACGPDGLMALTITPYHLRIWNKTTGNDALLTLPAPIDPLVFSADGRYLASGDAVWDIAKVWDNPKVKPVLELARERDRNGAFSPDGKVFASAFCRHDGLLDWFETVSWRPAKPRFTIPALRAGFHIRFGLGGKTVVAAGKHGHLLLLDPSTGQLQKEWRVPGGIEDIALSRDGRHLVTANANGTVFVLRLAAASKD